MTPTIQVNIDCADLDRMVDFYTAALGYVPYGSAGTIYRSIVPADGSGPKIVFQRVPEAKVAKNRVHLDLIVGDRLEEEARRFVALGATRMSGAPIEESGTRWLVLADPEGNELCLCLD
jgi:catechol 2,3-dioxygenase-like lactoylglutathione lyase family enzyme